MATPVKKDAIPVSEYVNRRERVLKELKGAAAVVLAGEGSPPLLGKWRSDQNFFYLTGLSAEPGAAVLFDPSAENPKRRCILLLKPVDPEAQRWDGYREHIGTALRQRTGFQTILRLGTLPGLLTGAARRCKRLACLHPFTVYPAAVSPDLDLFRKASERVPGVTIEDRSNLLPSMRNIKSAAELKLMQKAVAATAAGYAAAMKMIRPGVTETQIQYALERTYMDNGADGLAFNSIVGAGLNGTILHYMDNSAVVEAGDLLVIDSAAEYCGYAADVTRTLPATGRFTDEQRHVYEVVLNSQLAAIRAARPGVKMHEVDAAARNVIEKAGFGDAFIHSIGHPLGLEVHDVVADGPLKAGMVITIEPGVYLPDRKIGVRIEDDVLITARGSRVLSEAVPKTVKDVEAAMA